jgi:DNA (cytosine-5)-methyltransferase 1
MEAVRIIKEMRNATKQLCMRGANDDLRVYPRIAIWENVTGAYSSNGGEDFRCVLEELARIENPEVSIPMPKKWSNSGYIDLPHGAISWRTHDAQYWGVPQRRKRISLVVDFRDKPEPEIQFVTKGVSRDFEQGKQTREDSSEDAGDGAYTAVSFQERGGKPGGVKESSFNTTESEHYQHLQTKPSLTDAPPLSLDRASFNQGQNAQYDISIQEDIAQPIVARGPGGGNADKVNSLCARDFKGVGNQYVSDGKCIIRSE